MEETRLLELARQVMALPTAPFHEHFVAAYAADFARARSLHLTQDPCGNLLLMYDGRSRRTTARPSVVATAHMDHPGLGFPLRRVGADYLFEQLGGVALGLTRAAGVSIYSLDRPADQAPLNGRITGYCAGTPAKPACFAVRPEVGTRCLLESRSFAMWNLETFRKQGRLLRGRACDDLGGAAAGLAFLEEVSRRRLPARAGLLLTRAEEGGFGGMLGAVGNGLLDRQALYVNLECSSAKAGAALGAGPVVRVGDRRWTFDPGINAALAASAAELAAADLGFRYQRKLMDRGTCEATVLMHSGYRAGALALPMRNYHNDGGRCLRPEVVHLDDLLGTVQLLVHLVARPGGPEAALGLATRALETDLAGFRRHLVPRLRRTRRREDT